LKDVTYFFLAADLAAFFLELGTLGLLDEGKMLSLLPCSSVA